MAQDPLSLLVVEDSELDFELLLAVLQRDRDHLGRPVRACRVEEEAGLRAALARGRGDALITDHNLPRFDSFAALRAARALDADLPVIVLSGEMSEELAVAVLQAGADDFVLKTRMFRLGPALSLRLKAISCCACDHTRNRNPSWAPDPIQRKAFSSCPRFSIGHGELNRLRSNPTPACVSAGATVTKGRVSGTPDTSAGGRPSGGGVFFAELLANRISWGVPVSSAWKAGCAASHATKGFTAKGEPQPK
jgi:CheY-like chemotaxis protein